MTVNLDCLSNDPADLFKWWLEHRSPTQAKCVELFGRAGPGSYRAMRDMANYAANKGAAMKCRLTGDISTAQMYERICDSIYQQLPDYALW